MTIKINLFKNNKTIFVQIIMILLFFAGLHSKENITLFNPKESLITKLSKVPENEINISLTDAIIKSLKKNPILKTYKWNILSKSASVRQSKLLPNPEIEFEIENFAGSGVTRGFKNSESTLSLSQKIVTSKKRKKRINTAISNMQITENTLYSIAADIVLRTEKKFYKALYIQEKIKLREEMLKLSNRFLNQISIRIKAGRTPISELSRAKISLLRNRIILKKLKKELSVAKLLLSDLWGESGNIRFNVTGDMELKFEVPDIRDLKKSINNNTEIIVLKSKIKLSRNILKLEKALRIPDFTIAGGIRKLNESGDSSFTINFSLPIPLFNRNQGNIKKGIYNLNGLKDRLKSEKIAIFNKITAIHDSMENLYSNASVLKSTVLPEAEKVFKIILKGYTMGKFDFLNMIDAFRTQLEVKEDYLQSLYDYHKLNSELKRITGLTEKQIERIKKGDDYEKK